MTCIKTGCDVFLKNYNEWLHGDAFEFAGVLVIRVCHRSRQPESPVRHFTVINNAAWYDEDETSMARNSTLLVRPGMWTNHGYDGIPEPHLQSEVSEPSAA